MCVGGSGCPQQVESERRVRLNRERVLQSAVTLADEIGIDALSMRRLAQELGVVPMALYKHVENKEALLDGMVEVIIGEIDPPVADADWKSAVRLRVLSARRALQRHPWARQASNRARTKTPRRPRLHGLVHRHVLRRRLFRRSHAPRHACHRRPDVGLHPGTVRRHGQDRGRTAAAVGTGSPGRHDAGDGPRLPEHRAYGDCCSTRTNRSSAAAATTSSNSSSPSTCCSTASNGCATATGRRDRRHPHADQPSGTFRRSRPGRILTP